MIRQEAISVKVSEIDAARAMPARFSRVSGAWSLQGSPTMLDRVSRVEPRESLTALAYPHHPIPFHIEKNGRVYLATASVKHRV